MNGFLQEIVYEIKKNYRAVLISFLFGSLNYYIAFKSYGNSEMNIDLLKKILSSLTHNILLLIQIAVTGYSALGLWGVFLSEDKGYVTFFKTANKFFLKAYPVFIISSYASMFFLLLGAVKFNDNFLYLLAYAAVSVFIELRLIFWVGYMIKYDMFALDALFKSYAETRNFMMNIFLFVFLPVSILGIIAAILPFLGEVFIISLIEVIKFMFFKRLIFIKDIKITFHE